MNAEISNFYCRKARIQSLQRAQTSNIAEELELVQGHCIGEKLGNYFEHEQEIDQCNTKANKCRSFSFFIFLQTDHSEFITHY